MSGVTDCYQPVEARLKLTRRCLEVLAEFRNPVSLITKNALVTRDLDVLAELARYQCAGVCLSITTLDNGLRQVLEPRTSPPMARLAAIRKLAAAHIPVSVNIAPVIPGLTDHELPGILRAARDAGATSAGFTVLRLPLAVAPLFEQWLQTHFPDRKDKILNRLKSLRGGKLYDAKWGSRFRGEGVFAEQIARLFTVARRQAGFSGQIDQVPLSTNAFRRPSGTQLPLFK
jgi:DNA repair photolyase